jgi:hypothetical protein
VQEPLIDYLLESGFSKPWVAQRDQEQSHVATKSDSQVSEETIPRLGLASGRHRFNRIWNLFSGVAAREGYLAAADQGLISISNFLATILLARNVNPTELGIYGVGFVTLRLVRSIQDGILIQPLNVFGATMDLDRFKRYATSTSIL